MKIATRTQHVTGSSSYVHCSETPISVHRCIRFANTALQICFYCGRPALNMSDLRLVFSLPSLTIQNPFTFSVPLRVLSVSSLICSSRSLRGQCVVRDRYSAGLTTTAPSGLDRCTDRNSEETMNLVHVEHKARQFPLTKLVTLRQQTIPWSQSPVGFLMADFTVGCTLQWDKSMKRGSTRIMSLTSRMTAEHSLLSSLMVHTRWTTRTCRLRQRFLITADPTFQSSQKVWPK